MKQDQSRRVFPAIEHGPSETHAPGQAAKAELTGDEIRERMATVRLNIEEHSDEVMAQTEALSDWRYYVRRHPLASVAAAAVLGYVIVPARAKPGAENRTRNTKRQSAEFTATELRWALTRAAKRAAMTYASKTLGDVLGRFFAGDDEV